MKDKKLETKIRRERKTLSRQKTNGAPEYFLGIEDDCPEVCDCGRVAIEGVGQCEKCFTRWSSPPQ